MKDPVITTRTGVVRGVAVDGVARFLDIPYAAPPVAEARFGLPRLHPPWAGVRDGRGPGPNAPQQIRPFPGLDIEPLIGKGWVRGDDYLTVNVWTPDPGGAGLPVMVFIHGGAFVLGSNGAAVTDGSAFARSGVVCMAINYRLGIDGFLPIPGAPTNLGLRDQLFALEWIRDHAHAFGGDPANVTVFGESAGAMSIADLVASPLAKGLFRRAIIESGHGSMVRPIEVAERAMRKVARFLRIRPDLEGFCSRTPQECLKAVDRMHRPTTLINLRDPSGREPAFGLSRFLPVYGDDVLPEAPLTALAKGAGAEFDVLIGTNAEEMNLYFVPTKVREKIPGWLARYLVGRCEPQAGEILKAYGLGEKGRRAGFPFTEALHDLVFRLPARRYAAAHRGRTHFYEFDWRSPAFGGQLGACHGIELPFVFNTLACCTGANGLAGSDPPQALADRVHRIWVRYATDGTLPWGEYDSKTREVYTLEHGTARPDPVMPAERYFA